MIATRVLEATWRALADEQDWLDGSVMPKRWLEAIDRTKDSASIK
jgi:hypothetical protein